MNLALPPEHVEWSEFKPGDNTSVLRRTNIKVKELSRLEDRRHLHSSRQSWNSTVQVLDLTATDPNLDGFSGGFESGGYGYFVPFRNNAHIIALGNLGVQFTNHGYSGKVARVDLATFSQVQVLDLTATDPDLMGFRDGFVSGGYGYVVPNHNIGDYFGKVTRFSIDPQGSSFVLIRLGVIVWKCVVFLRPLTCTPVILNHPFSCTNCPPPSLLGSDAGATLACVLFLVLQSFTTLISNHPTTTPPPPL